MTIYIIIWNNQNNCKILPDIDAAIAFADTLARQYDVAVYPIVAGDPVYNATKRN